MVMHHERMRYDLTPQNVCSPQSNLSVV